MKVEITIVVPAKEVSGVIELVESIQGKVTHLSASEISQKTPRKKKVFVTKKIIRDVLDHKKKHPAATNKDIAKQFEIGASSIGRILSGDHPLMSGNQKKI